MVAPLHAGSLLERDDRAGAAGLAGSVDRFGVVAHVKRGRLGGEATILRRVEQRGGEGRFVRASRLDLPRDREVRAGADGGVDLVAVEAAALARRDGRAVSPACVGIGEPLALARPPFDKYRWPFA
jgi:hypothetical protein